MAEAKKCDRCGKYYEYTTKYTRLVHKEYVRGVGYRLKCSYDLCDECRDDLYKFMNIEETQDVT